MATSFPAALCVSEQSKLAWPKQQASEFVSTFLASTRLGHNCSAPPKSTSGFKSPDSSTSRRCVNASSSKRPQDGVGQDAAVGPEGIDLLPARMRRAKKQLPKALPSLQESRRARLTGSITDDVGHLASLLERQLSLEVDGTVLEQKVLRSQAASGQTKGAADILRVEQLRADVLEILEDLGLLDEDISGVLSKVPTLPLCHGKEDILVKLEFLAHQGMSQQEIASTVRKCPEFLPRPLKDMQQVVDYLILDVGISRESLGRVVSNANCLPLQLETNLRPKVDFLRSLQLGDLSKLVEKYPRLLAAAIDTLGQNVDTLVEVLGHEAFIEAVWKQPGILAVSTKTIVTSARQLKELLPEAECAQLLASYPHALTLDWWRNVQPKLDYLTEALDLTAVDVIKGKCIHRSLERVIQPRVRYFKRKGVSVLPSQSQGRSKNLKNCCASNGPVHLSTVMNLTEETFLLRFPDYNELMQDSSIAAK